MPAPVNTSTRSAAATAPRQLVYRLHFRRHCRVRASCRIADRPAKQGGPGGVPQARHCALCRSPLTPPDEAAAETCRCPPLPGRSCRYAALHRRRHLFSRDAALGTHVTSCGRDLRGQRIRATIAVTWSAGGRRICRENSWGAWWCRRSAAAAGRGSPPGTCTWSTWNEACKAPARCRRRRTWSGSPTRAAASAAAAGWPRTATRCWSPMARQVLRFDSARGARSPRSAIRGAATCTTSPSATTDCGCARPPTTRWRCSTRRGA